MAKMNANCQTVSEKTTIAVLTLNCWGIPLLSSDYSTRMKGIAAMLRNEENNPELIFDVVCLQEVWRNRDFEGFKTAARESLPYSHYFYSGVIGAGICILSKWPIIEVLFHQWQLNGYMHKIFHGDWFGGKGVGLCRIDISGFKVNVFTTHLHAQYGCASDEYLAHRVTQAFDTAQFIRLSSEGADMSILAGDLNTEPEHLCYRIVKRCAILEDTFMKGKYKYDGTFDCQGNMYANKKEVSVNPRGKRIDHIFFRAGDGCSGSCLDYYKPLVPKDDIFLSDHEGVAAKLELLKPGPESSRKNHEKLYEDVTVTEIIERGKEICMKAKKELKKHEIMYWLIAIPILTVLLIIPMFTSLPSNYAGLYTIFSSVATIVGVFASLMATIWNRIESHGISNAYEGMTFLQEHLSKVKRRFSEMETAPANGSVLIE